MKHKDQIVGQSFQHSLLQPDKREDFETIKEEMQHSGQGGGDSLEHSMLRPERGRICDDTT